MRFPPRLAAEGFAPLADYVHSLGLKFGIHMMRGIPERSPYHRGILGTELIADRMADPYSICPWNPDMYGVRPEMPASQTYYDSIFALYADWGVDFIKCDDICREDAASAHRGDRDDPQGDRKPKADRPLPRTR